MRTILCDICALELSRWPACPNPDALKVKMRDRYDDAFFGLVAWRSVHVCPECVREIAKTVHLARAAEGVER